MLAFLGAVLMSLSLIVPAQASQARTVIPLGKAVGIKLFADGALVVAVEDSDVLQKRRPPLKIRGRGGQLH